MCLHVDDNQGRIGGVPLLVLFVEGVAHSWLMWTIPHFRNIANKRPWPGLQFCAEHPIFAAAQ